MTDLRLYMVNDDHFSDDGVEVNLADHDLYMAANAQAAFDLWLADLDAHDRDELPDRVTIREMFMPDQPGIVSWGLQITITINKEEDR